MYVPNLSLTKVTSEQHIVRMITAPGSAVGTTAYIISNSGVQKMLQDYRENGYTDAVPNVMSSLFPNTRFAAYPMVSIQTICFFYFFFY